MSALHGVADAGCRVRFADFPLPTALAERARNLPEAEPREPDPERLESAVATVRRSLQYGAPARVADLRLCASALWDAEHGLASEADFAEPFARAVEVAGTSAIRAVAKAYLHAYPMSRGSIAIESLFGRVLPKADRGWFATVRDSRILRGDEAVAGLARAALESPNDAPSRPWQDAGLTGGLAASGYAGSLFEATCAEAQGAPSRRHYERLRDLLFYGDGDQDYQRFPTQAATNAYIAALLGPWREAAPDPNLRRWIQRELIDAFGDPRTEPQRWSEVPDDLVRVLRRWLTEASLDQFLDIAGRYAEQRMWKYRRPFWMSYFESGAIQDAWVHFGRRPLHDARVLAERDEEVAGNFGGLHASDRDQSVLLLRMGDYTVAEWTHNGQAWIWQSSRGAPKLYQDHLTDVKCRGSRHTFGQRHVGAATYRWQHAVATELERLGIPRTDERDWRPD